METLDYDPATGVFTWKPRPDGPAKWNTRYAGKQAGQVIPAGYRVIAIDTKAHYAHRLAWLWVHGEWPAIKIEHRNRRKDDNWIDNLRLATNSQNGTNKNGVLGVTFYKPTQKWRARIMRDKREIYLGYFLTKEEAIIARNKAATELHGEFAVHIVTPP